MIYVHWLFLVAYAVVVIGTMIAVIMDNRQPAKTMAWILVLWFIPLLGIVLYFFFGQNVRRDHIVSSKSLDQLTKRSMLEFVEQRNLSIPAVYRTLIDLFANQQLALPFKGNAVEIYTNGYEFSPLCSVPSARPVIIYMSMCLSLPTMPLAALSPMPLSPRPARVSRCALSTTMWPTGR